MVTPNLADLLGPAKRGEIQTDPLPEIGSGSWDSGKERLSEGKTWRAEE